MYVHRGGELDKPIEANPPTFTHFSKPALDRLIVQQPKIEHEQSLLRDIEEMRQEVLGLPVSTEGINIDRLESYLREMDAPSIPILFLDPESFEEALIISMSDWEETDIGVDTHGVMLDIGVCIVRRDPSLEALNGTSLTESFAVHEIAHGTTIFHPIEIVTTETGRIIKKSQVSAARTRRGFIISKVNDDFISSRGSFLEEGYAEYERGQYVQQIGNPDGAIIDHLRLLEGFSGQDIGPHYWFRTTREGNVQATHSLLPATLLEALITVDPELLAAMRESRYSIEGLRAVPKLLNRIQPGLYYRLQSLAVNNFDDLTRAAEVSGKIVRELRAETD